MSIFEYYFKVYLNIAFLAPKLAPMNHTFKLKNPNKDALSLIYFRTYFKDEGKSFIYSTGEKIHPKEWDFQNNRPTNLNGRTADAQTRRSINKELNRYSDFFQDLTSRYRNINEQLTFQSIKEHFDENFKRNKSRNGFFKVYDQFLAFKGDNQSGDAIAASTLKRYEYNKSLLEAFESDTKHKIHLNGINEKFFNNLVNYCVTEKKHSANTLSRNIGLFKTFLHWAYKNKFTYNNDFLNFKNVKKFQTDKVALDLNQVTEIYEFDFAKSKRLEKVRDIFVLGCATSLRFGNYSRIQKSDVNNGKIRVRDIKDPTKILEIPLNKISKAILEKYDYNLPKYSNQKFNKYIKEVFEEAGYDFWVKKTMKYGSEIIGKDLRFYDRISSHTARRSFITIMRNQGVPDEIIMKYTGHKSREMLVTYYKPNKNVEVDFMNKVFK